MYSFDVKIEGSQTVYFRHYVGFCEKQVLPSFFLYVWLASSHFN